MPREFHFIAGLPRSGSTVLSALLRQNPRFAAAVTSPVSSLIAPLLQSMSAGTEFAPFFGDERRQAIMKAVFDGYYYDVAENRIVFDTNRTWTGKTALLNELFPSARIICCVREVGWILDSYERMLRQNPLQPSRTFDFKPTASVFSRADILMNPDRGVVGLAWSSLREAWFSPQASTLILLKYETLVKALQLTMERLYQAIGEPYYSHDFGALTYDEPTYDAHLGMPGMHQVKSRLEYQNRAPSIPPELFSKYAHLNFWTKLDSAATEPLVL